MNILTLWGKISAAHCDKKCGADIAAKNIIIIPHFGKIGPAVLAQFQAALRKSCLHHHTVYF